MPRTHPNPLLSHGSVYVEVCAVTRCKPRCDECTSWCEKCKKRCRFIVWCDNCRKTVEGTCFNHSRAIQLARSHLCR